MNHTSMKNMRRNIMKNLYYLILNQNKKYLEELKEQHKRISKSELITHKENYENSK